MVTENSRSPTEINPDATLMEDSHQVAFMVLKGYKIKLWRDTEDPRHIMFEVVTYKASTFSLSPLDSTQQ